LASKLWKITPGYPRAQYWPDFLRQKIVAMSYAEVGDLSSVLSLRDLEKLCARARFSIGEGRSVAVQLWDFAKEVRSGDAIVAAKAGSILGLGRVAGVYFFAGSPESAMPDGVVLPHRIPVEWAKTYDEPFNARALDPRVFRSLFFPQDVIHEVSDLEARTKIAELFP
jgi:predicted Mrr-cat superfamily restriction endonuclease